MAEEYRKPIKGYEGLYEVSNLGRVKRIGRSPHILAIEKTWNGRCRVRLCKNNNPTHGNLARMVAEAFIENPDNKPEINHIDGNPLNNVVNNLEWATKSENCWHRNNVLGVRTGFAVDKDVKVLCVETGKIYNSMARAAKATNTFHQNISKCVNGTRQTAGGFHWELA